MSIRFSCRCGKRMKAPDDKMGRKILCPACGESMRVPERDTAALPTVATSTSDIPAEVLQGSGGSRSRKPHIEFAFDDRGQTESGYSGLETLKLYGRKLFPVVAGVVLIAGLYWLSSMIVSGGPKLPPLGEVSGRVTLNGKPLADALVEFHPVGSLDVRDSHSISTGRTDGNGEYELTYDGRAPGAVEGRHVVVIKGQQPDGFPLLTRYRDLRSSELSADIELGHNRVNFQLKTGP